MSPKGENSPLGQDRQTQKDTQDLLMVSAGVSTLVRERVGVALYLPGGVQGGLRTRGS